MIPPQRLQTNGSTFLGRYWTEHSVLRRHLPADDGLAILSFGCSSGEELLTLRTLFPVASLFGCDVDWQSLASARALVGRTATIFESSDEEIVRHGPYDVIVCNSVLLRHTVFASGRAEGLDATRWIAAVGLLDSVLRPGGIIQIVNSNIPFRYHPVSAGYRPLRSPLILGPSFVDMFELTGRQLCSGVPGAGFSGHLHRHIAAEAWQELSPHDFHDVHFLKAGGTRAGMNVDDEVLVNAQHGTTLATGSMSYRPAPPQDARPSTYVEVDLNWTATGPDTVRLDRTARRVWFDGAVPLTFQATIEMGQASATAFIESALGRRSTRLDLDGLLQRQASRVASF